MSSQKGGGARNDYPARNQAEQPDYRTQDERPDYRRGDESGKTGGISSIPTNTGKDPETEKGADK